MDIKEYQEMIEELNNVETTVTRKTELLTTIQEDYVTTQKQIEDLTNQTTSMQTQINDVTHANSLLFRKLGLSQTQTEEQHKQKNHSETITLDAIEGGY